jgi:hypothetical protein
MDATPANAAPPKNARRSRPDDWFPSAMLFSSSNRHSEIAADWRDVLFLGLSRQPGDGCDWANRRREESCSGPFPTIEPPSNLCPAT